jgi:6-phosphogluconolactonase (cycloisomerase 2 family)
VLLLAAFGASAAELTFQQLALPSGSPALPVARTVISPDGRFVYGLLAQDNGGVVVYARDRTTGALTFVDQAIASITGPSELVQPLAGVVTPDGRFLIVTAREALVVFQRNAVDGTLTFVEAETGGFTPPLVGTLGIAITRNGAHVYAGLSSGRVLAYARNATTGTLTYLETEADDAGAREFQNVRHLGLSPDDAFLYASSDLEGAVTVFTRDSASGLLSWSGSVTEPVPDAPSEFEFSPAGDVFFQGGLEAGAARLFAYERDVATAALNWYEDTAYAFAADLPSTAIEPDGSHVFTTTTSTIRTLAVGDGHSDLELPPIEDGVAGVALPGIVQGLTMAPDARHLYVTGSEGSVAIFAAPVLDFLEADADGVLTPGHVNVSSVAASPDGDDVYATGMGEDAIQVFSRNARTGALAGSQIVRDGVAGVSGLDGVRDVVVSPSGAYVYAVSANDDAAVSFARNASGQLSVLDAVLDGQAGARLDGAFALAISPDGKNVYVASDG